MKKLTKFLVLLLAMGFILMGCDKQIEPTKDNETTVETVEKPESTDKVENKTDADSEQEDDKDLGEVSAIFYSMNADKAEMLILDWTVPSEDITLKDEARVFLTDKESNAVVSLSTKITETGIEVYDVKDVDKAYTKAKYIGFADNNFAEFEIRNKSFMLYIPDEIKPELEKVDVNELIGITIKTNETPMANAVLEEFKTSP